VDGYSVTVFEKEDKLGGMMTLGIPAFRLEKDVVEAEIDILRELGVKFETGVEVGKDKTIDDLKKEGFDGFYLAIGASAGRKLGVDGEDANGVILGVDFLKGVALEKAEKLHGNVVVIGGGLVGCETGLFLAELGKAVTIVEMQDEIAPEANWMHKEGMMQAFAKQNITTVTGRKVVSISEDGVTVADKNNETTVIASDSVVYAIGMRPNNHLVDELRDSAPFVRAVGDCVRARKVSPAIYEAYYAAVDLA